MVKKSKTNKLAITAIAALSLTCALPAMAAPQETTAYETETEETLQSVEEIPDAVETSKAASSEDVLNEPSVENKGKLEVETKNPKDFTPNFVNTEGDESVTNALNTGYSEETPCQINAKGIVPDSFGLNFWLNIKNMDTGKMYQISLYADNRYEQRCYVPAGTYTVTDISVFDDTSGKYVFDYPDDFTLTDNNSHTLTLELANFDEIDAEIKGKKKEILGEDAVYDDEEDTSPEYPEVESDFEVVYKGEGLSVIGVTGTQNAEYDLVFKVVKGGVPGTATVMYSTDKGQTFSGETTLPLDGYIDIVGTGLTAAFVTDKDDATGFVTDDVYTCYIPDPDTELVIDNDTSGATHLSVTTVDEDKHVYNILEDNGLSIKVNVDKSGEPGEAVVSVSLDGGKTYRDQETLPESGQIVIDDYGLILDFTKDSNIVYLNKDDTYSVIAVRKNYNNIIYMAVGIGVMLLSALTFGYIKLKSYLPKKSQYRINTYAPFRKET